LVQPLAQSNPSSFENTTASFGKEGNINFSKIPDLDTSYASPVMMRASLYEPNADANMGIVYTD